jgi:8-oxo-dGTP diphosphatase
MKESEILLAMKKCGFGINKWNGVGGKVRPNESRELAATREAKEEIGVDVDITDLREVGDITFYFNGKPDWNQQVYIYSTEKWTGEPAESDEMRPQWFEKTALPFDNMWVDDRHWVPIMLEGKRLRGEFYFNEDGSAVEKYTINEIDK